MIKVNVAVVIPAAGRSERCSSQGQPSLPKQYYMIMGKPLFMYSVEAFLNIPYVKKICLVTDNVDMTEHHLNVHCTEQNDRDKIVVVQGGASRHASIKIGLVALKKMIGMFFKVVIIHDGARPFVPTTHLTELVSKASLYGAAGCTRPLTSTVVRGHRDGHVDECLDRSTHVASETPQAFSFNMLHDAYHMCTQEELRTGTECLHIAHVHGGVRGFLLPGPETLWKVTYQKDFNAAAIMLRGMHSKVCLISREQNSVVHSIQVTLQNKVAAVNVILTSEQINPVFASSIVCFHDHEIDEEWQVQILSTVLDVNKVGVIVYVVMDAEEAMKGSVYDLLRSGRSMMNQYHRLNKGVVVIEVNSPNVEERLVRLVSTIVLSDPYLFSGQTLFL